MTDNVADEHPEPPKLTFAEFLETSPPNQIVLISDLVELKWYGNSERRYLKTPEIQIHCSEDTCNGIRFHRCSEGEYLQVESGKPKNCFIIYTCSNCENHTKIFSLRALRENGEDNGAMMKFGENPVFGPPIPPKLLKLIGTDRDNFLKGRRCENQGLGVGAFVYYRRVVENQKNRIFKEIVKVSEKIGAPKEKLEVLNSALKESQFTKALDMAKDAMPESLLINGHSPLKLIYRALSEGIHNLSDEECLGFASSIRIVLGELSERLSQALKDEAEIINALNRLLVPIKK